jgi:Sensors of blue-light using FAD
MYRIIYLSSAVDSVDDKELNHLLLKSREWNLDNKITGILLHIDGDFIQVLEGDQEVIEKLFAKISTDNRHKGIIVVSKSNIEKRQFEDWSMGYKSTNYKEINNIDGLKEFDRVALFSNNEKIALTFLSVFIQSHKNHVNF